MNVDLVFEDTVRTCLFYTDSYYNVEIDSENYHVTVEGYGVDPVMEDGVLAYYHVEEFV